MQRLDRFSLHELIRVHTVTPWVLYFQWPRKVSLRSWPLPSYGCVSLQHEWGQRSRNWSTLSPCDAKAKHLRASKSRIFRERWAKRTSQHNAARKSLEVFSVAFVALTHPANFDKSGDGESVWKRNLNEPVDSAFTCSSLSCHQPILFSRILQLLPQTPHLIYSTNHYSHEIHDIITLSPSSFHKKRVLLQNHWPTPPSETRKFPAWNTRKSFKVGVWTDHLQR